MPLSQLGFSLVSVAPPALSLVTRLSSQNLRETRQSNHCTGVTEIADLCVTTPSLNMNRFRIKSATASRDPRHSDGDCLSDHNGVYSFSSSSWWEAGGDYKFIGGRNSGGWRNLVTMIGMICDHKLSTEYLFMTGLSQRLRPPKMQR